jgi:hypothetical protein
MALQDTHGQMAVLFQALAEPARLSAIQTLSTAPRRAGQLAEAGHLCCRSSGTSRAGAVTRAAMVSSDTEVAVSPDVAVKAFTEEMNLWWVRGPINFRDAGLPAYTAADPEGNGWTFAQVQPTQRP